MSLTVYPLIMQQPPPHIQAWLDKYPAPKHQADYVEKKVVLDAMTAKTGDYIIIDLRRDDFKGGRICGALNLPAQSFYGSVTQIYDLAAKSGKKHIFVHCMSSRDRAIRTCGWLEDEKARVNGSVKPLIIQGGFLAWIAGGKEYTDLVDEYDPSAFQ